MSSSSHKVLSVVGGNGLYTFHGSEADFDALATQLHENHEYALADLVDEAVTEEPDDPMFSIYDTDEDEYAAIVRAAREAGYMLKFL